MSSSMRFGKKQAVYQGNIFTIYQQDVVLPNGEQKVFEYCERPSSVSVLALNEKNELLLIHEYRHGYKKNVWFLPSGRVEKNEQPLRAAHREMREETGFDAKNMQRIFKRSPSNTLMWDIFVFAARDLVWKPLPQDPGECITVEFVPLKKAVQMALDGTIENEFIAYNIIRFEYMLQHNEVKW